MCTWISNEKGDAVWHTASSYVCWSLQTTGRCFPALGRRSAGAAWGGAGTKPSLPPWGTLTAAQARRCKITVTIITIYMLKPCLPQQSDKYLKILYIMGSILDLQGQLPILTSVNVGGNLFYKSSAHPERTWELIWCDSSLKGHNQHLTSFNCSYTQFRGDIWRQKYSLVNWMGLHASLQK